MNPMRVVVVTLVLLVAGCSSDQGHVEGPLLTSAGDSGDGMAAIVAGPVTFSDGCLLLGDTPVVWPESTSWDADAQAVTLPGGEVAEVGTQVTGGGGYLRLSAVADLVGQEVADAARPCLGPTGEVAVFNPGSDVSVGAAGSG